MVPCHGLKSNLILILPNSHKNSRVTAIFKKKQHFSFYKTCFDIPLSYSVAIMLQWRLYIILNFYCIHDYIIQYAIKFRLTIWILEYTGNKGCVHTNSSWNKNMKLNKIKNEKENSNVQPSNICNWRWHRNVEACFVKWKILFPF